MMVAYHFPPLAGSSGIQRTLRFVQYLQEFGWLPIVLSADPRAYERQSDDLMREIPESIIVNRAFALDAARHLSIMGRYPDVLARPDRWMSWRFDGVRQGLAMIRRHRPSVIWSTFPIPTAHRIGLELHKRSGLPWIADFRDPMAQKGYPADPSLWRAYDELERETVAHASLCVFTTPGAERIYRARYPEYQGKMRVIENGYDEQTFASASVVPSQEGGIGDRPLTLLHSGIVYPRERDPSKFFLAIQNMNKAGRLREGELMIRFRAPQHSEYLVRLAHEYGVQRFVEISPPIPYADALQEMLAADGLLVMQGASCNDQIPAKTYEYLRAGRPVLCLADPAGDTAGVLRKAGMDAVAPLEDADRIGDALIAFMHSVRMGTWKRPDEEAVRVASRRGRCEALASLMDSVS